MFAQASFSPRADFSTRGDPVVISSADLSGDGKPDLVELNYDSGTLSIFINTTASGAATPTFSARTDFAVGTGPFALSIADLNGDGKPDLIVANSISNTLSVFLNTTPPGATTPTLSARTDLATGLGPQAAAIGDLNGDGKPDLIVACNNDNTVSVFLNTTTPGAGTPTFSTNTDFTTGTNPRAVAIGDFNGDGMPDIVVSNYATNSVSVLLNTTTPGAATPTFSAKTDFTTGHAPHTVAIGDINGDGMPDLVVANHNSNTVSVLLNATAPGASTPTFSAKTDFTTGSSPFNITIGDINKDGLPDLAVSNLNSNTVSVFLNTTTPGSATPTFLAKTDFGTGNSPYSVTINDLNGDGKPDIAVVSGVDSTASVLLNTMTLGVATPTFSTKTDFTTATNPYAVAIGDLNGDGKPDIVAANSSSNSISVFFNTTTPGASTPTFSGKTDFSTGNYPNSVAIGDLNGDGKPDVVTANLSSNTVTVLLNTTTTGASTPTFATASSFSTGTGSQPYCVTIGDLNGDGKPDLVIGNYASNSFSVFLNTMSPGAGTASLSAHTDIGTVGATYAVAIGDFNGDGKLDVAATNFNDPSVSVFLNTTAPGSITPSFSAGIAFGTGAQPISVAVGDFNGDGMLDMAVANFQAGTISVFLNTMSPGAATATFSSSTDFTDFNSPCSVAIKDLNGDGKPDMVVSNYGGSGSVSVFLNTTTPGASTPTFSTKTNFGTGSGARIAAIGDLNGDGKPDLAVPNLLSSTLSVLLNNEILPLPVEMTSLIATAKSNTIELKWKTATESNNYGFEVERRTIEGEQLTTTNWIKVGFIQGSGTSSSPREYTYSDPIVTSGRYDYRIKQIDNNGVFKYSASVEVEIGNAPHMFTLGQNYPNPFNPTTTIEFTLPEDGRATLKIYNTLGQEVATLLDEDRKAGTNYRATLNASSLASGTYFARLEFNGKSLFKKILLIK